MFTLFSPVQKIIYIDHYSVGEIFGAMALISTYINTGNKTGEVALSLNHYRPVKLGSARDGDQQYTGDPTSCHLTPAPHFSRLVNGFYMCFPRKTEEGLVNLGGRSDFWAGGPKAPKSLRS